MVILIDDEDDGEEEHEESSLKSRSSSQLRSNYTADALPWDAQCQVTTPRGRSRAAGSGKYTDDRTKQPLRRTLYRQPADAVIGSTKTPAQVRPGYQHNAKAQSSTSTSDQSFSSDDGRSIKGEDGRPLSPGNTVIPIRGTMQPKSRIAGSPSPDGNNARKPPINMPGRANIDDKGDIMGGRPPARKTYKSLSPYGILFEKWTWRSLIDTHYPFPAPVYNANILHFGQVELVATRQDWERISFSVAAGHRRADSIIVISV